MPETTETAVLGASRHFLDGAEAVARAHAAEHGEGGSLSIHRLSIQIVLRHPGGMLCSVEIEAQPDKPIVI